MNSRENFAISFLNKFDAVDNFISFHPNKMMSKDGLISYEYDMERNKSSLYLSENKSVDGSYALDVFLLYIIKCKYINDTLPVKRLFSKRGLTEASRKRFNYIFKDIKNINDYLLVIKEIEQEYPEISVLSTETLDGKTYLNGDAVSDDIDMKEYLNFKNEAVEWTHWECGKEHVISTFIGIEFFALAKLQNHLKLLDIS